MADQDPLYAGFLGTWVLIPESCEYEQGDPPRKGTYTIERVEDRLSFRIAWTDSEGESHTVQFSGVPDGQAAPFDGGELVDAISITAVSERELTSRAYWKGQECMVAQRQLDDSRTAMRVIQLVRFEGGSKLANTSVYRKRVLN